MYKCWVTGSWFVFELPAMNERQHNPSWCVLVFYGLWQALGSASAVPQSWQAPLSRQSGVQWLVCLGKTSSNKWFTLVLAQLWPAETGNRDCIEVCGGQSEHSASWKERVPWLSLLAAAPHVGSSSSFKDRTVNFACGWWYKTRLHMSLKRFSTAISPKLLTSIFGDINEHVTFLSAAPVSHYPFWAEEVLCCLVFQGHSIFLDCCLRLFLSALGFAQMSGA